MTLRHLEIFVKVAKCGKMSEAAKELFIAQSSVSQAVLEIERQYNVRLFERLSKKLYLTDTGEQMLRYAQHIMELYGEMDQRMRYSNKAVRIRVGSTVTIGVCLIGDIINEFCREYPGVNIEVMVRNTPNIERRVLSSELDIALVEGQIKDKELVVRKILTDQLVLVVGKDHPFYTRDCIAPSDLDGQPFILREEGSGSRQMVEEFLQQYGVTVRKAWRCNNFEAMKNAVVGNHGISLMSMLLVKKECGEGTLRQVPIQNVDLEMEYSLVYHKDKFFTAELAAFAKACEDFQTSTRASERVRPGAGI